MRSKNSLLTYLLTPRHRLLTYLHHAILDEELKQMPVKHDECILCIDTWQLVVVRAMPTPVPAHVADGHEKLSQVKLPFSNSDYHHDELQSSQSGKYVVHL